MWVCVSVGVSVCVGESGCVRASACVCVCVMYGKTGRGI